MKVEEGVAATPHRLGFHKLDGAILISQGLHVETYFESREKDPARNLRHASLLSCKDVFLILPAPASSPRAKYYSTLLVLCHNGRRMPKVCRNPRKPQVFLTLESSILRPW